MRCGGITVAAKQGCVGLSVVEEAHGEQAREGVIGREANFNGGVAHACRACTCGNVATDAGLLAVTQVESHVQVVVGVALRVVVGGVWVGFVSLGLCFLGARCTQPEEFEVVDAIGHAQNPVATNGFVNLNACHAEVEHAR